MKKIIIIACMLLTACNTSNTKESSKKTYKLTKDDIMVIWKNGYVSGELSRVSGNNSWKSDSITFMSYWE